MNNPEEPELPDWENMPEPYPILTLSWEDIYPSAFENSKKIFNRNPTKDEIKDIFKILIRKGIDCDNGTFWSTVEFHVDEYYKTR